MADSLRARKARGDYDTYTNAISFSLKLNREVGEMSRDKRMRVSYSVRAGRRPWSDALSDSLADVQDIPYDEVYGFPRSYWVDRGMHRQWRVIVESFAPAR